MIPSYLYNLPGKPRGMMYTGYLPTDEDGRVAIHNALQAADDTGKSARDKELRIVNCLLHPASYVDPLSGEERFGVRTVLVTDDGRTLSWGSDGVASAVMNLGSMYGAPPWSPALVVIPRYKPVGQGREWAYLHLVGRAAVTPTRSAARGTQR